MVSKKIDGKWVSLNTNNNINPAKIKTSEQFLSTEEDRFLRKLPVNIKSIQDADYKDWFNKETGQLVKEGYTMNKNADGSYTIMADKKAYESYYQKKRKVKNGKKRSPTYDIKTSYYVPHEIYFDKKGNIIKEIMRNDYEFDYDYNKRNDGGYERTKQRKVYDSLVKEYDNNSKLISYKEYKDFESYDKDDTDGDRRQKREVYLAKETKFNDGQPTNINEWDTYKSKDYRYEDKDEKELYDTYKKREIDFTNETGKEWSEPYTKRKDYYEQKKWQEERNEQFRRDFDKAETNQEKQKVLERYGATITIDTPDGKKYRSGNIDWLENQYKQAFENVEGKNYYSINTGNKVDLSPTEKYDPDRFAFNKVTGGTIDRFTQQSVAPQNIAYEKPDFSLVNYANQQKGYSYEDIKPTQYTDIGIERGLIKDPSLKPVKREPNVISEYKDDRNVFQKTLGWLDYQAGKIANRGAETSGLFKGYDKRVIDTGIGEGFKEGYNLIPESENQLVNAGTIPARVGLSAFTGTYNVFSDVSGILKNFIDYGRYDKLGIKKYKTEFEKSLENKQNLLTTNLNEIEFKNNELIKELANIEQKGEITPDYYVKQEQLIANNEKAKTQVIDYLELEKNNPMISKNRMIEINNQINDIKGLENQQDKKWYGFLPESNYSHYLTAPYWGAFALKGGESLYEFFSQPINWHPYGAIGNIAGKTVTSKGDNLIQMGKQVAVDPLGTARDIYLINKAYGIPKKLSDMKATKYTEIKGRGSVPKEFRAEFKAYQKAFEKVAKNREVKDLNWKTIQSLKGLNKKQISALKKIYKNNPEAFITGSTLAEAIGIKPKRASRDIDTFVPDKVFFDKTFANKIQGTLKKAGLNPKYQTKFNKQGEMTAQEFNFGSGTSISVHPYSMMVPNLLRPKAWYDKSYYTTTKDGIKVAKPELQVYNKITDAFRFEQKNWVRYGKDTPWGVYTLRKMLEQDLAKAKNYPPIFKQIGQYKAGQGLEWIKPYKAKGYVEQAKPVPNYYTGKTPSIFAGLKYVDIGGKVKPITQWGKKGQYYPRIKTDYTPVYNLLKSEISSIKYPLINTNSGYKYTLKRIPYYGVPYTPQGSSYYGTHYNKVPTRNNYPQYRPFNRKPYMPVFEPTFVPKSNDYNQIINQPTYNMYDPVNYRRLQVVPEYIPDEPTDPTEKKIKDWEDEKKKKKKRFFKKRKYRTNLDRLQDPFYRLTGKKRYGMDINKLLRDRYGNIYA